MEKLGGAPSILDVHNKINELVDAQNAEVPVEVPTKVSDLENDAGYITASVNTLANYYTKSETYTKTEVDGKITELNEDLDGKLDKRTQTTEYAQVYIKTAQGTQSVYDLRSDFAGNSVVLRDSVGAVNTAEPNSASNATTKNYVDGLVSDLSADITTLQSTVLKNSGNQTLNGNLTVTGNTVVQGNLTVQGTTITKDAESLVVQDNVIVTNSNGTTLTDLSGLFIKTGATGGYAVVYDPTKDAVILGEGTIDGSNVVTIQASERKAIVTRQDGDTFTDKNIVMWDAEHNGLVDSGMTRSMIALRNAANTFSALQTFSAGISVSGSIVFGEHTLSAPIGDGQIARMSDIPTKLPNPAALTFGTTTYDGSAARTITADSLGALTQATADGLYQSKGNYLTSIPLASSTVLGGVKSATTGTTAGRDYRVQVNTDGTMKVNVPWTDTNTTYSEATTSTAGLMSSTDKTKLDGIQSGAQKNTVLGVKGSSESAYRTGNVNITKANIGLGNVDNTSDENKPVSTATQTALNGKANTSGTYPNLTVGKATNADNAANATKADAIKQTDTRSTNELPTFYYNKAAAGQNFTFEFKESAAIGLTGQSTYCQLQTYAKWTDSTGGNITQVAVVDTNYFIRTSTGSTGWGAWQRLLKEGEVGTVVKSASEWSSQNPVLGAGVFGYDSTNKIIKAGDGTTAWKTLPTLLSTDFSFEKASWSDIAALSESGSADKYFSVGDEKTISLTTGEQVTLVILGFDHDDLTSGGKAGMSIGMKNLLATKYRMNATATNEGGWDESEMRTSTMATLLSQLPSDLQSVIKQVNKKATAGSQSENITTSADKLWLLAEVEVDGTTSAGYADEGEQYEYWKTVKDGTVAADRIKYLSNGSGSAHAWWLRSPYVSNSYCFRCINSTGVVNNLYYANTACGVSFGFCV